MRLAVKTFHLHTRRRQLHRSMWFRSPQVADYCRWCRLMARSVLVPSHMSSQLSPKPPCYVWCPAIVHIHAFKQAQRPAAMRHRALESMHSQSASLLTSAERCAWVVLALCFLAARCVFDTPAFTLFSICSITEFIHFLLQEVRW